MKYLILENIRSAHNVGSIFRTADGVGVDKVYLVGYTPTPTDRFGRVQPEIKKTSLGASNTIPWEHHSNIEDLLRELTQSGVTVVAVEQAKTAIKICDFTVPDSVAYILGNEVAGVSKEALALSEQIVELPMLGKKESLNVSVTAGVILYYDLVQN